MRRALACLADDQRLIRDAAEIWPGQHQLFEMAQLSRHRTLQSLTPRQSHWQWPIDSDLLFIGELPDGMVAVNRSGGSRKHRVIRRIPRVIAGPVALLRNIARVIVLAEILIARLAVNHRPGRPGRELMRD